MSLLAWIFTWLFRCNHRRITWPLTLRGRTWVTCLGCGREFAYDWKQMEVRVHDGNTSTDQSVAL